MCVTMGRARLSDTILYGAVRRVEGQAVHVLGYQNAVQNLAVSPSSGKRDDFDWGDVTGSRPKPAVPGNAMILPFPAVPGSMTKENVLDTSACPHILKDMASAIRPAMSRGAKSLSFSVERSAPAIQVFDHGIYTVVLASSADSPEVLGALVLAALETVPAEKRPAMNDAIVQAYLKWYPNFTVAFCCFNNRDKKLSTPLLWSYRPMYPGYLFLPALDSHTGGVPDVTAQVERDTTIVLGTEHANGSMVSYQDFERFHGNQGDPARQYLAEKVIGTTLSDVTANGDWLARVSDVDQGIFEPKLLRPPGA